MKSLSKGAIESVSKRCWKVYANEMYAELIYLYRQDVKLQ